MQVTDDVVRVAWAEFQKAFHEHADTEQGYHEITRRALTAALAAMWRPIEEAPKDRTRVLLYTDELTPPTIQAEWRSYDDQPDFGEWVDVWNNDPIETSIGAIRPAAWMPLPSPPKAEG
jgi:hypothetical protein